MSATAYGTGRLLSWEDLAMGLTTSLSATIGHWDAEGSWVGAGDYEEQDWRSELWMMGALTRRAALFVRVPFLVAHRADKRRDELGGGIGDLSVGLRYELLAVGEYTELPAVALSASISAPTGRSTADSGRVLGADVTGRGAWTVGLGLSIEKTKLPWFVRMDLGAQVPLPTEREDLGVDQRLGAELTAAVAGGIEVAHNTVVSLVTRVTWHDRISLDGDKLDGTTRLDLGLSLAGSYRLDPHWTIQLAVDTGVFVSGLGRNLPGRVTGAVGLRYGYF